MTSYSACRLGTNKKNGFKLELEGLRLNSVFAEKLQNPVSLGGDRQEDGECGVVGCRCYHSRTVGTIGLKRAAKLSGSQGRPPGGGDLKLAADSK